MIDINEISQEYVKCLSEKTHIYMIEHFLKTYDATQRSEVPYKLFPKQKDLCLALSSGNNVCTTKPRQAGITTTTSAFLACEMVLASPESPITVLAIGNTLDLAQQFVTKIRDFIKQVPRWFFGDEYWSPDEKSEKNNEKIFVISNNKELKLCNGSRVVARSSGPDASRGVGGVRYLVFDEAAFIENGRDVYASALPTVSQNGNVVLISTPNGKDSLYYATFQQAKQGKNNFTLVEMEWFQDPRYNKFLEWTRKNDEGEIEIYKEPLLDDKGNVAFTPKEWEQRKKDGWKPRSPWYVNMCQSFNNDPQKIAQELDVSFLGSDSSVIAPEFIEMQRDLNVREPMQDYKDPLLDDLWVWKLPIMGHRYIMGIDNSTGSSDDATALEIIDLDGVDDDGSPCIEQVLEYNGKLTGDVIGEIAFNYGMMYNQAFIVVEDIGGYGSATILSLLNLKYPNLYYDDPTLKNYTSQNEATTTKVTENGLPGFHSNSVRFQMLSHFANLVRTNQYKIRSSRVCNELETWIYKNGRMDHKDGCHDDTITCSAMTLFVVEFSINRKEQLKQRDETMLKAMININNRIVYTPSYQNTLRQKQDMMKKYAMPIYTTQSNNVAKSYQSSMWVFK